ncbi:hypothetical protein, partial [Klebsiella pneumoniae]|uniref:hypothetical protein n=1 Tax=Klebsiella pneumoniae TaxID=573 RepID=UPI003A88EA35
TPESVARIERGESTVASAAGFAAYNYGLGNAAFPDKGPQVRGHNGGIDSFTSVYGYSVAANAGYVILANGGYMPVWLPALQASGLPTTLQSPLHTMLASGAGADFYRHLGPLADVIPLPVWPLQ